MAKYVVQVTDEAIMEIDSWPGAPQLSGLVLTFRGADALDELGGAEAFTWHGDWVYERSVPITRDGEPVGMAIVRVIARALAARHG